MRLYIDRDLPLKTIYYCNLKRLQSYYTLSSGAANVVADLNSSGLLTRCYCLIQKILFHSQTNNDQKSLLVCSCDKSQLQRERLNATEKLISESEHFYEREKWMYLIIIIYKWAYIVLMQAKLWCQEFMIQAYWWL